MEVSVEDFGETSVENFMDNQRAEAEFGKGCKEQ